MKWILCIVFPPLGVIAGGGSGLDFGLNFVLCFLGVIPGMLHALYICNKYEKYQRR
ncbi:MAG TPA: YqaE/Pmp3 family membrane protein [Edaphocola sp.]|nr:YqaE/Pmp3 family membrane protein [Edaphocola sp.]